MFIKMFIIIISGGEKQIPKEYIEYFNFVNKKMFKHLSEVHRKKNWKIIYQKITPG